MAGSAVRGGARSARRAAHPAVVRCGPVLASAALRSAALLCSTVHCGCALAALLLSCTVHCGCELVVQFLVREALPMC
ncbi:hypothetical protein SLA2020_338000 [Shorea laevis]